MPIPCPEGSYGNRTDLYEEQQCSTLSIEGDEPGFAMNEFFAMVRPAKK